MRPVVRAGMNIAVQALRRNLHAVKRLRIEPGLERCFDFRRPEHAVRACTRYCCTNIRALFRHEYADKRIAGGRVRELLVSSL